MLRRQNINKAPCGINAEIEYVRIITRGIRKQIVSFKKVNLAFFVGQCHFKGSRGMCPHNDTLVQLCDSCFPIQGDFLIKCNLLRMLNVVIHMLGLKDSICLIREQLRTNFPVYGYIENHQNSTFTINVVKIHVRVHDKIKIVSSIAPFKINIFNIDPL